MSIHEWEDSLVAIIKIIYMKQKPHTLPLRMDFLSTWFWLGPGILNAPYKSFHHQQQPWIQPISLSPHPPRGLWSLIGAKWTGAKSFLIVSSQNNEGKEVGCRNLTNREALCKFDNLPFVILKMGVMLGPCHSGLWWGLKRIKDIKIDVQAISSPPDVTGY